MQTKVNIKIKQNLRNRESINLCASKHLLLFTIIFAQAEKKILKKAIYKVIKIKKGDLLLQRETIGS